MKLGKEEETKMGKVNEITEVSKLLLRKKENIIKQLRFLLSLREDSLYLIIIIPVVSIYTFQNWLGEIK